MTRNFRQLERIVRGFSNHRRIQILHVLAARPELDLMELADACETRFRNASEHVRRLAIAGLVLKRPKANRVLHALSARGHYVLEFIRGLK